MDADQGHPIKVVVRRTGLSPHVIRVWEKRYQAVEPMRTETNRRRYSDADIERLLLLQRATHTGRSIGQIAHLTNERLRDLVHEDETASPPSVPAAVVQHDGAKAVALSVLYPADDPRVADELLKLRRYLSRDIVILVGGRGSHGYQAVLDTIEATQIHDLAGLRNHLETLRSMNA